MLEVAPASETPSWSRPNSANVESTPRTLEALEEMPAVEGMAVEEGNLFKALSNNDNDPAYEFGETMTPNEDELKLVTSRIIEIAHAVCPYPVLESTSCFDEIGINDGLELTARLTVYAGNAEDVPISLIENPQPIDMARYLLGKVAIEVLEKPLTAALLEAPRSPTPELKPNPQPKADPPLVASLESMIDAMDCAEAKIALVSARAAATKEPFNEILLKLCYRGAITADDSALLLAVTQWQSRLPTGEPDGALDTEDGMMDLTLELSEREKEITRARTRHAQLISDLASLPPIVPPKVDKKMKKQMKDSDSDDEDDYKKKKEKAEKEAAGKVDWRLKTPAVKVLTGYAKATKTKLPLVLYELHLAGAIQIDDKKLCEAMESLHEVVERWEDTKFEAAGEPMFMKLRDPRGRRLKLCFLGNAQNFVERSTPQAVLVRHWGLARPSTGITLDAGTTHPRYCDEVTAEGQGLTSLPKFQQFLKEAGEDVTHRNARKALRNQTSQLADRRASISTRPTTPAPGDSGTRPSSARPSTEAPGDPGRLSRANTSSLTSAPPSPPPSPSSPSWPGSGLTPSARVAPALQVLESAPSTAEAGKEEKSAAKPKSEETPASKPTSKFAVLTARALEKAKKERAMEKAFRINDLIHDKMLTVFTALLDAATLSNSWIVIDRTLGEGGYSATAEYLLEVALERCSRRPTIIVIDSLQRLREASNVASNINDGITELEGEDVDESTLSLLPRTGKRSYIMHNQLKSLYEGVHKARANALSAAAKKDANGTEQIIDFRYTVNDFATPDGPEGVEVGKGYSAVPDEFLPADVVHEHKTLVEKKDGTPDFGCAANRKWAYFYDDSVFSSGTHYIIKNQDVDEFRVSSITTTSSYLYAHGDKRTSMRLRTHIQQGHQIVMLYNSGGITQIFSWLQRVMAHNASPPSILRMRDPLELLVAAVPSTKNLVGVPEMLIFQTIAERAPHLFRKKIVSVDLLLDNDEKMLQTITGCFSGGGGGMPELGLGNAETVVQYSAWSLVLTLHTNARWFKRASDYLQLALSLIAVTSTVCAIIASGAVNNYVDEGSNIDTELIAQKAGEVIIVLPIVTVFFTAIAGRMKWRDKWSICHTGSSQIVAEIYNFRMGTGIYNPANLGKSAEQAEADAGDDEGGGGQGGGQTELTRRARELFSERCQLLYGGCLKKLSDGSTIFRKRQRLKPEHRIEREHRYTFKEWMALKLFLEHTYYRSRWAMPLDPEGLDFDSWITGLRPYLERTLQDELLTLLETMESAELEELQAVASEKSMQQHPLLRDIRHRLEKQLLLRKDALQKNQAVFKTIVLSAIALADEGRKAEGTSTTSALAAAPSAIEPMPSANAKFKHGRIHGLSHKEKEAAAYKAAAEARAAARAKVGEVAIREQEAREALSSLQGEADGLESKGETRKAHKFESVEDDYLVGALPIESYVVFRTRPILERLERRGRRLAITLQILEVFVFIIQGLGTVLAALSYGEWVALTVTVAGVITERIASASMREQLVTTNLAACSLHNKVTWWDAQTLVVRRAYATRRKMVETTEAGYLKMIEGHANEAAQDQEDDEGDGVKEGKNEGEKCEKRGDKKSGKDEGGG